ncbi:MAG: UDP-glucose/GDP-mannose dehydrogenase family protein [Deltaproteobacteria bacterium]|nr:UDP-glucose/GDP-mannose dehydrogenase family protein [Deltaproteobacteria bacterium]
MKIAVVGTGYVGLVTGVCLADMGNDVVCMDLDASKIDALRAGSVPIYEPGIETVIERNVRDGRLAFTADLANAVQGAAICFIAVGTPKNEDGAADVRHVLACADSIARSIDGPCTVVVKSTVPVGTCDLIEEAMGRVVAERGLRHRVDVVSNPEFLKEGSAVEDFMRPDRVVVGITNETAGEVMRDLYSPFTRNGHPVIVTDRRSSEMIKYASNAMLATRISFMNDLAALCEAAGVDIEDVRKGVGTDRRIGMPFLYAGVGYGGSCFPKDVRALVKAMHQHGGDAAILEAVERVNERQKLWPVSVLARHWQDRFDGKRVAVWGLAFKPNTDDMREAPSLSVIEALRTRGAAVAAHDPVAVPNARRLLGDRGVEYVKHPYDALKDADALVLLTEWGSYRTPDFARMRSLMRTPLVLDGRNQYNPEAVRKAGFEYFGVGRGTQDLQ